MKRIALACLFLCLAFSAGAQDWPLKPVKFVVPFPPGGSVDPLARLMAKRTAFKYTYLNSSPTTASNNASC